MNDQTPFPYGKRKPRLNEWEYATWTTFDRIACACTLVLFASLAYLVKLAFAL